MHATGDVRTRNRQGHDNARVQRLARAMAGQAQTLFVVCVRILGVDRGAAVVLRMCGDRSVVVTGDRSVVVTVRRGMHAGARKQHGQAEHGGDRQAESIPEHSGEGRHGQHDVGTAPAGKPYLRAGRSIWQSICKSLTAMD